MENNTLTIEVDHHFFKSRPDQLRALAELYCHIWMFDENFGEYRQCPVCKRYFSHTDVEINGVTSCSNNHSATKLSLAWDPAEVMSEILAQSNSPNFYGVVALDVTSKQIIGFAWTRLINWSEIQKSWGEDLANQLRQFTQLSTVAYFDELAVDHQFRSRGVGSQMARMVCGWMKRNFPNHMSLLRTHQNSPARRIYTNLGYKTFAADTEYGGGRVMMFIHPLSQLPI